MKLYEINESIRAICETGIVEDTETGEITYEGPEGLEALEMERSAKVLAIAKVIKEQTADLDAYEAERKALAKRMLARGAALEKRIEWLRGYLTANCAADEKLKDGTISVSFRKTESVSFDGDAFSLPEDLRIERVSYQPNKDAIKAAIREGQEIAGATIVERITPSIR